MTLTPALIRLGGKLLPLVVLLAFSSGVGAAPAAKGKIDFNSQIRPIISSKCYHCHGPDEESRKADLRLDSYEEATRERKGKTVIKPGDLKKSELVRRITSTDPDDVMPPPKAGHPLTPTEMELLKRWVQQGGEYAGHWAFESPSRPALPKVKNRSWPKNAIDYYILAKLEENKLKPVPAADRHALVRRLSFDLTGLPPTPSEVEQFVHDKSPDAYEKLVDRLLNSPAYGEKWTRMWLDIARYADSHGYGQDSMRANAPWPYRDWVINAFNRNMPYDRFTIDQLAGDLLEKPSEDQLVATAFHRNTMTNLEGGTDDEEWRVAAVKDRANVTAQTWMGLTMGCAQCHTHKFDPITQKEYYQFYAFFNQTEDNDQPDERPTMPLPTTEQKEKMEKLKGQIAELEKQISVDAAGLATEFETWEKAQANPDLWKVIVPENPKSGDTTTFTKLDDDSLLAGTNSPGKDTYTLKFRSSVADATAVRLEVLPDESLPGRGPGRNEGGNFVLNELRLSIKPESSEPKVARYVRVELPGAKRILSLAEVQVMSGGKNIATKGKATQSSVAYDGPAPRAIDGNTNGLYEEAKSTTHTDEQTDPWWEVDLGEEKPLDSIVIWNRMDAGVVGRLSDFHVRALNKNREAVWATQVATAPKPSTKLSLDGEETAIFKRATATHSQGDFEVTKLIDGQAKGKEGWAIGGGLGKKQFAILEFSKPMPAGIVTIKLVQNYGTQHTIGRFRLALSSSTLPLLDPPSNVASSLALAAAERSAAQRRELLQWFQQYAAATAAIHAKIEPLRKNLDSIMPRLVPVMRELPENKRRTTRLLVKGNFLTPGEEVSPGIPSAFNAWPKNAPVNRLGVAQWLMSPDNPLTARVTANRIWGQLFGLGIVETEEDFGTQGSLPTHPELLDWLAIELRDNGWNMKQFLKTIVTSATYQQTSRVTPAILEKDPRNIWLSRSPRRRLDAEMIRDQALALSGLLSRKIGGPSVYPPQPEGLWRVAFDGTRNYQTSTGEDRYRRGIYTVWRRTIPYPSMATFDAPSRETCTFRRLPTNTPLQAYVTLNDPAFIETAQALGRRLMREGGSTTDERIQYGLQLVLARAPGKSQVAELRNLFESELTRYRSAEPEAVKLATNPLGALPEGMSAAEAAAWTVVANILLNLDGVLTKG